MKRSGHKKAFNSYVPHNLFNSLQTFHPLLVAQYHWEVDQIVKGLPDSLNTQQSLGGNYSGPTKYSKGQCQIHLKFNTLNSKYKTYSYEMPDTLYGRHFFYYHNIKVLTLQVHHALTYWRSELLVWEYPFWLLIRNH